MNYLETMKNIAKDKRKRVENLIFLIILLVILLISINYIFSTSDKTSANSNSTTSKNNIMGNNVDDKKENIEMINSQTNLENKLSDILSKINGISDVSVLLTYSTDTKQNVVYNTKEENSDGKTSTEKSVAYNEQSGQKSAIVESVEMPKVEGAIIVAKGANSVEMRSKLASTISSVTGIAVYKVQVFEKQG